VQQGDKLVGSGSAGKSLQGFSVALNADGNTAVVGGAFDYGTRGATWVFKRTADVWKQQGDKLVATDTTASLQMEQGHSVGVNAAGNIIITGGFYTNDQEGAAWIFVDDNGVWVQRGAKLLGRNAAGPLVGQGYSVGLSADGNTAIVGGEGEALGTGAVWAFTDSSGILPVTLTNFKAFPFAKGVQTMWVGYNEINISSYDVEKSTDGYYFNRKATLTAKGNPVENDYSWFDAAPVQGDNFYRIKAINRNGAAQYSATLQVSFGHVTGEVKVYPNPTRNKTIIANLNNMEAGVYTINIYNLAGQKMYSQNYTNAGGSASINIRANSFATGIYIIEVKGKSSYGTKVFVE
jgi:hypothetical protein